MKQYKIFRHPSGSTEAVKQGWSWPAFFFSWIWAMVKRMWVVGILAFVPLVLVNAAARDTNAEPLVTIVNIVLAIVFAVNGNSWREKNLLSRGYEWTDTVSASNPEGATAVFLKSLRAAANVPLRAGAPASTLGCATKAAEEGLPPPYEHRHAA